jgi:hypothetical protein
MRSELEKMTQAELRAYLIAHPKHKEAFHFYIDTVQTASPLYPPVTSVEVMERILRDRTEGTQDQSSSLESHQCLYGWGSLHSASIDYHSE